MLPEGFEPSNHDVVSKTALLLVWLKKRATQEDEARLATDLVRLITSTRNPLDLLLTLHSSSLDLWSWSQHLPSSCNCSFRQLVADSLREYSDSSTKLEKSYILRNIVTQVRLNSPNGGFVKKDPRNGRWYEVGDFLAREKTSQTFRDALYEQYKSSNTAKKLRRLQDQDVHLPHRSFSAMGLGDFKGNASMSDVYAVQRPNMSSLMQDHAVTLMQSCPNLGQNMNQEASLASMRNFEWDQSPVRKVRPGMMDALLAMSNGRQSSARSVMDFATQYQQKANGSSASFGHFSGNLNTYDEMEPISLAKQPEASISLGCSQTPTGLQHHNLANDVFDRLVNLVGNFDEGDPFEPQPVVADMAIEETKLRAI